MCHEYLINDHPVDKVAKGTPSWGSRGSKDAVACASTVLQGDAAAQHDEHRVCSVG